MQIFRAFIRLLHFPAFITFIPAYIYNIGSDLIIRKFPFCVRCISFYLLHVLRKRFGECQHLFGIFIVIVLELYYTVVCVIICAGDACHFKVRPAGSIVLFDSECVATAQLAGDKFIEGASNKVLVYFIKYLCGELSQILFKIVFY